MSTSTQRLPPNSHEIIRTAVIAALCKKWGPFLNVGKDDEITVDINEPISAVSWGVEYFETANPELHPVWFRWTVMNAYRGTSCTTLEVAIKDARIVDGMTRRFPQPMY